MPSSRLFITLSRTALFFAVIIIFILSVIRTGPELPGGVSDKVYHALAFFVLSLLSGISFYKSGRAFIQPLILLGYGIVIEVVQYYIPYRSFSIGDMVADAVGIVAYQLLFVLIWVNPFFTLIKKRE